MLSGGAGGRCEREARLYCDQCNADADSDCRRCRPPFGAVPVPVFSGRLASAARRRWPGAGVCPQALLAFHPPSGSAAKRLALLALAARCLRCCPQRSLTHRALFTCICARRALFSSHISLSSLFPTTVRSLPFLDTYYTHLRLSSASSHLFAPASPARAAPPAAHTVAVAPTAPWPVVVLVPRFVVAVPALLFRFTVLAPWIPSSRPARPRLAARFGRNPPSPPGIGLRLFE